MSSFSDGIEDHHGQHLQNDRKIFLRATILGFLGFLLIFPFVPTAGPVFRLFSVPSTSMAPNIKLGQFVLASRASYGYNRYSFDLVKLPFAGRWPALLPNRGDVVVFRLPRDPSIFYIKRIIGLPKDRVQLIDGRLWINGRLIDRESVGQLPDPLEQKRAVPAYIEKLPEGSGYKIIEADGDKGFLDNTQLFEVPEGQYFVLGDNRDNSVDSRVEPNKLGVGYVPLEFILGRVIASF